MKIEAQKELDRLRDAIIQDSIEGMIQNGFEGDFLPMAGDIVRGALGRLEASCLVLTAQEKWRRFLQANDGKVRLGLAESYDDAPPEIQELAGKAMVVVNGKLEPAGLTEVKTLVFNTAKVPSYKPGQEGAKAFEEKYKVFEIDLSSFLLLMNRSVCDWTRAPGKYIYKDGSMKFQIITRIHNQVAPEGTPAEQFVLNNTLMAETGWVVAIVTEPVKKMCLGPIISQVLDYGVWSANPLRDGMPFLAKMDGTLRSLDGYQRAAAQALDANFEEEVKGLQDKGLIEVTDIEEPTAEEVKALVGPDASEMEAMLGKSLQDAADQK